MNQLSGERAGLAGGGCRNAPGAARPQPGEVPPPRPAPSCPAPPRQSPVGRRVLGYARLVLLASRRAGAAAQPRGPACFLQVTLTARGLEGSPRLGLVTDDLFPTYCDYGTYLQRESKIKLPL